jgi:general L-amino acid transport system permease protein
MGGAGLSAEQAELMIAAADAEAGMPPIEKLPPREWVKKNLFNNVMNSVITVISGVVGLALAWFAISWAIDADFAIIRANLRLFMVGRFPRDDLWRLWASGYLVLAAIGFTSGALAHSAQDDAIEKGLPVEPHSWPRLIRRFWAIAVVMVFFVSFARTWPPYLGVVAAFSLIVVARESGWRSPQAVRERAVYIGAALGLASMLVLAGTGGLGRLAFALLAAVWASSEIGRRELAPGAQTTAIRWGGPLVAAVVSYVVVAVIPLDGYGWDEWGGLHLTLFVTVIGIALGLPIGILLALGRKSDLPIIKGASVIFIEFVRGVPLITLLLFSNLMLALFFPLGADIPSELTRSMIVITAFSAAYIAEIVRGGLQSVPAGQTEAAQASGLSPGKVQRLIVLPQALRNVIPAMVGQFIALFKDTSLLAVVGLGPEFLRVTDLANAQPDFRGKGLAAVTYLFVAIGYWAFAYTMSKEARRLETRLGVGIR